MRSRFADQFAGAGRWNRIARRVLVALAVVAIAGNLAFWLAGDRLAGDPLTTAAAGQSQKLVLATAGGAGKVLVATRD
ncbi:MAG TPA: hypothetical protein VH482_37635, partial [Thermomicrobiales bacterium]